MKKTTAFGVILVLMSATILSGCGGDFARRADGTCVFVCNGGGAGG